MEKTDVREHPGHPEEVHVVVVNNHGNGGGHANDDHQKPELIPPGGACTLTLALLDPVSDWC